MVVKTITVTEEAYNSFKQLKQSDESFSDLMKRISGGRKTVNDIYGALKGKIDIEELQQRMKDSRKKFSEDWEERDDRLRQLRTH